MRCGKVVMIILALMFLTLWSIQADAGGRSKRIPAPVPQTGQTTSWLEGDDGDLQMGVPWPDPRFTDRKDGTVKDNLTGLIWLKNANCFGPQTWVNALVNSNNLENGSCGLSDNSIAGDWRLPNIKELGSLLDFGQYGPALASGHPFVGDSWSQGFRYWSSTTYLPRPTEVWYIEIYNGVTDASLKEYLFLVWPVRDAQ